ncbi:MAG: PQQ-dependent sugar dehydrogenase [Patescibacteria group bacterium]|nr:PQQ-dependent sugar dehydrogenase [Patescibacteria group bacterium]
MFFTHHMSPQIKKIAFAVSLILLISASGIYGYRVYRGIQPVLSPVPQSELAKIPQVTSSSDTAVDRLEEYSPLKTPAGWRVSTFSRDVPGARDMAVDEQKNIWVSQPSQGTVSRIAFDGQNIRQQVVLRGLRKPHGLTFDPADPNRLFVAEETKIFIYDVARNEKIYLPVSLPSGGRHTTRTMTFDGDRLLVSVGSSCDTCIESQPYRASVISMNRDGGDIVTFAKGLRNAVFITQHPVTHEIWGTEMGRDLLGDDLPPDEVNILFQENDYGWPWCFGDKSHDDAFDIRNSKKDFCQTTTAPKIELPAHSAPLGLAFIPATDAWPADWRQDLLIAYHGSWNRSVPTGYKVVRVPLDEQGNVTGEIQDFITGWLTSENQAIGRPVDLIATDDGKLFISDDKAGVVYIMRAMP